MCQVKELRELYFALVESLWKITDRYPFFEWILSIIESMYSLTNRLQNSRTSAFINELPFT